MKEKSIVVSMFEKLKQRVENKLNKKVRCLHTNNRRVYISQEFDIYLKKVDDMKATDMPQHSITKQCSQNKELTFYKSVRNMPHPRNVSGRFWAECMRMVAHNKSFQGFWMYVL